MIRKRPDEQGGMDTPPPYTSMLADSNKAEGIVCLDSVTEVAESCLSELRNTAWRYQSKSSNQLCRQEMQGALRRICLDVLTTCDFRSSQPMERASLFMFQNFRTFARTPQPTLDLVSYSNAAHAPIHRTISRSKHR